MRSHLRVETVSVLDFNEDSSLTSCGGWFRAFAMGSSFWVEFALWAYALGRNEGLSCTSILESFVMGSPYGPSVVRGTHSFETKDSLGS